MLRVTIDLIPQGNWSQLQTLELLRIAQVSAADIDFGGLRTYEIGDALNQQILGHIDHYRSDGLIPLVQQALGLINRPPE